MRSVKPGVSTLIEPTTQTLTIPQPEIAYAGIFNFLTGQEPEGYQGANLSIIDLR